MDLQTFFKSHLKPGAFPAGIVSIDIVGHSSFEGSASAIKSTLEAFHSLIESQLRSETAAALPWQGDGGVVIFDATRGCDHMLLFADRIRHLVVAFNRTRGLMNKLPDGQEVVIRIVCHAGTLDNTCEAESLNGAALNSLCHNDKEVAHPGHIVITGDVYRVLAESLRTRCTVSTFHRALGQTYVFDSSTALCTIQQMDSKSRQLGDWIVAATKGHRIKTVLYFGYTNELLHDLLCYGLGDVEVKILARNWIVERQEEDAFKRGLRRKAHGEVRTARPWSKSDEIRARAKEFSQNQTRDIVQMRFYDGPPIFNGAILLDKEGRACTRIGVSRWEEDSPGGGSPYKLDEWPAMCLEGHNPVQAEFTRYLCSRFWETWRRSRTYEELCELEDVDPELIQKVWGLDGLPYLIVYPHRYVQGRPLPVIAHEDHRAFRMVEEFLKKYEVKTKLLSVLLPHKLVGDWFPKDADEEIEKWPGHVVYICSKVISSSFAKSFEACGFPYEFHRIGRAKPFIRHRFRDLELRSPTDASPPEARDYSLVAKVRREGKGSFAYVLAGIRAMGTCGATQYFVGGRNVGSIAEVVDDNPFAAVIETTFDPITYEITGTVQFIAPERFAKSAASAGGKDPALVSPGQGTSSKGKRRDAKRVEGPGDPKRSIGSGS